MIFQNVEFSFQGCNQTSEQDEASFARQTCEPLGGTGDMPAQKILKSRGSAMLFYAVFQGIFPIFSAIIFQIKRFLKKGQNQDEAKVSSCLMLATALLLLLSAKRERPVIFFVICERAVLFSVKRDLLPPFTTLS